MTRVSDVVGHWLGLCRKAPAAHALQTGFSFPPEPAFEGQPGGGGSGSGSVHRGIESALSGMRTLNRNRQLLWFTLLAGLVLAGTVIAQGALGYITWAMQPYIGETEWIVLNFIIEFATLFLLVFLLTGLILSISSKKDSSPSFFERLTGAKKYLRAIVVWSFILAIAGMLLFSIYFYSPGWFSRNDPFLTIIGTIHGPVNVLYEFPFNPALIPSFLSDPYREGGIPLTSWIYPSGIVQALTFSVINLLLFILTAFVVPFIVLEHKTLREAVVGSFALMKKNWAEVAACAIFLLVIAIGVLLTYLLVQAASGIATPEWGAVTIRPENTWIALAIVYDAALFCFAIVMATVGGIAAMNLYTSAKSRQITAESAGATGGVT
nr:glycerophosphoryl diester phosphodiesterase membrane domain-containing protein [uncultured Methanoregula sp.]